ncbi:MAG TPA: hypothetical protein VFY10_06815 [Dehalococcoidia bacterium]|nr:hypothetical protein [Dehalococcoidia bacterium]
MAFIWMSADGEDGISVSETAAEVARKLEDDDTRFIELTHADDDEGAWRKVYVDRDSIFAFEQGTGQSDD